MDRTADQQALARVINLIQSSTFTGAGAPKVTAALEVLTGMLTQVNKELEETKPVIEETINEEV